MNTLKTTLTFSVFICFISLVFAQGKSPCHANKEGMGQGIQCKHIQWPSDLCGKCSLKETSGNGEFYNCNSIHDLYNPGCKAELQKYVDANPCDFKRKQQVEAWSPWSIQQLDYFVYSMCEECCDCIHKGRNQHDYFWLKSTHTKENPTLFTPKRGNCPAHAYYDVCKVLPNIASIGGIGSSAKGGYPKICPALQSWFWSSASNNWLHNQNTWTSPEIQRFLNDFNEATSCTKQSIWQACVNMEKKQDRV